jgi:hypothetical protein
MPLQNGTELVLGVWQGCGCGRGGTAESPEERAWCSNGELCCQLISFQFKFYHNCTVKKIRSEPQFRENFVRKASGRPRLHFYRQHQIDYFQYIVIFLHIYRYLYKYYTCYVCITYMHIIRAKCLFVEIIFLKIVDIGKLKLQLRLIY